MIARQAARRGRWLRLALLAATVSAGACGPRGPAVGSDVALRIDHQDVVYRRFERYLEHNAGIAQTPGEMPSDRVLSRLFDRFIDQELLLRLALGAGFDPNGEGTGGDLSPITFLLDRALGREQIDQARIDAYYESHRADYDQPELVHVWQILVSRRALAVATRQAIADGEPFLSAVHRLEGDPDANFCGDQGFLSRDDLPPSLADAIFALDAGETSAVLEANFGFYLFWVEEKKPPSHGLLEPVVTSIRETLRRARFAELESALIQEGRARYNVHVFVSNLPFGYQGSYDENR